MLMLDWIQCLVKVGTESDDALELYRMVRKQSRGPFPDIYPSVAIPRKVVNVR